MSDLAAVADVLHENKQRLSFYICEAENNANIPQEKVDVMLANEYEFVAALDQAVDALNEIDAKPADVKDAK